MLRTFHRLPSTKFSRAFSTQGYLADKVRFNWEDGLDLKSLLTEDEVAISETAHDFSQSYLYPKVIENSRTENFSREVMKSFGELGLLGPTIQGYGCAGVSTASYGLIAREVERVDSGYRSALSVQSSLVMLPINEFGSEELKEKYLPRLASGDLVGCFGLTEPNHGSDPASMETTAKPHPTKKDTYVLNGSKMWITNSPLADVMIVWAKLDGKVRGFLVDRNETKHGVISTPKISNKVSLRASTTGSITLEDVEVPAAHLLSPVGLKGPFTCLNSARLGIAWGSMGALEEALHLARNYSLERTQFGQPLAKYQLIQKKLADALTDINYGFLAALQVSRLKDTGAYAPEMISMIKRHNCDRALENSRALMQIFGGNAAADEYHIGRIVQNLQTVQTYEGQSDIHALILGRAVTGENAFF